METIHPNDIISMDLNTISYLTLKNGNMVLIDDSVPEKGNKENMKLPKSSIFGKNEQKMAPKKIKLEITPTYSINLKGIIRNLESNDKMVNNNNAKNKIIKNENFCFKGIKNNNNEIKYNSYEKENIPINNLNMNKSSKLFINDNNISNTFKNPIMIKENQIPEIKTVQFTINNNNINYTNKNTENDINSMKIEQHQPDYLNNKLTTNIINTNASIPLTNSYNNNLDNKTNSNNINNQQSKKKNKSKIFGFFGKDKKVRISINAVCSLNIKAEDKYKINLINQFNELVDRLNGEREKGTVNKILEREKTDKYSKFYPLYKNKTHNEIIKKNMEFINQNYSSNNNNNNWNNNFINDNNIGLKNKTLNNFYKKENNAFNNSNVLFNQNIRRDNNKSSNEFEKLKNKIQKYSSGIIRPSNRMINI